MNGPEMNDDDVDATLEQAGDRLREEAPTAADARDAYNARRPLNGDEGRGRSWLPAGIGIGLVAATIIGIVALQIADRPTAQIQTPTDTAIPVDTLPTVLTPSTAPTTSTTSGSTPSTVGASTPVATVRPEPQPGCGDAGLQESSTEYVVVVACRVLDSDGTSAAIAARLPKPVSSSATLADATSWFTSQTGVRAGVAELDGPVPLDGLDGVTTFTGSPASATDCLLIVGPDTTGWREICTDPPLSPPTAFALIGDDLVQLDLNDPTAPTADVLDERVWPSSGCSLADATAMARTVLEDGYDSPMPGFVFTGLRCDGDRGSLSAGPMYLQPGGVDGAIAILDRLSDGSWDVVDLGTGIAEFLPFGVPTYATWAAWPGDTDPVPANETLRALIAPDGVEITDLLTYADQLATRLEDANAQDPEFPAEAHVVAIEPDGLPLVVVETSVGGDDSVSGQVVYVWLEETFDAAGRTGWAVEAAYVSQTCHRDVAVGEPTLCI